MIKDQKIIAIIPARGGSKGLPGKNIKPLSGLPLISWTIKSAQNSRYIDEIFVTTDSSEIAGISDKYGIKVPFLRPDELAKDTSSSMDVVEHVINYYETQNQHFDFIILLEPTSPLRKKNDIDNAIEKLMENEDADGIVSVGEVHMEHPLIVKRINEKNLLEPYILNKDKIYQRQQADKAYFPYGVIYLIKTKVFKEKKAFYTENIIPYFIERWQNYEVDDIYDFLCIESILEEKKEEVL